MKYIQTCEKSAYFKPKSWMIYLRVRDTATVNLGINVSRMENFNNGSLVLEHINRRLENLFQ